MKSEMLKNADVLSAAAMTEILLQRERALDLSLAELEAKAKIIDADNTAILAAPATKKGWVTSEAEYTAALAKSDLENQKVAESLDAALSLANVNFNNADVIRDLTKKVAKLSARLEENYDWQLAARLEKLQKELDALHEDPATNVYVQTMSAADVQKAYEPVTLPARSDASYFAKSLTPAMVTYTEVSRADQNEAILAHPLQTRVALTQDEMTRIQAKKLVLAAKEQLVRELAAKVNASDKALKLNFTADVFKRHEDGIKAARVALIESAKKAEEDAAKKVEEDAAKALEPTTNTASDKPDDVSLDVGTGSEALEDEVVEGPSFLTDENLEQLGDE